MIRAAPEERLRDGQCQHGGEVALGHLAAAPWKGPQEDGAKLFPVVCGGGIAESHTE